VIEVVIENRGDARPRSAGSRGDLSMGHAFALNDFLETLIATTGLILLIEKLLQEMTGLPIRVNPRSSVAIYSYFPILTSRPVCTSTTGSIP
jgi:hypothetical protein